MCNPLGSTPDLRRRAGSPHTDHRLIVALRVTQALSLGVSLAVEPRNRHILISDSFESPALNLSSLTVCRLTPTASTMARLDVLVPTFYAETLIAIDHRYDHQYGYVGGLGWDLETAVDDAVIPIRIGTLATINTAFWADKL